MRRAFSMIELVIVVLIIGMVAAVAVPRLTSAQSGSRLVAAENRLLSEFGAVGEQALAMGQSHTIQFHVPTSEFRVYEGSPPALGSLVRTVRLGQEPYRVQIVSTTIGNPDGFIVVNGHGMYSAGAKVQISVGGSVRAVTVEGPMKGALVLEAPKDGGVVDGVVGGLLGGIGGLLGGGR